jgi:hypothetical protein
MCVAAVFSRYLSKLADEEFRPTFFQMKTLVAVFLSVFAAAIFLADPAK